MFKTQRNFYNSIAEKYNKKYLPSTNKTIEEINFIKKHLFSPDSKILDFGCGTGRIIKILSESFTNIYGADISEKMLNIAKKHLKNIPLIHINSKNEFIEIEHHKPFDLVLLMHAVVLHINNQELKKLSSLFASIIQEGGFLIIDLPDCSFMDEKKESLVYCVDDNTAFKIISKEQKTLINIDRESGMQCSMQFYSRRDLSRIFSNDFNLRFYSSYGGNQKRNRVIMVGEKR